MPQEARCCPRARFPSDSSRTMGSCLSHRPERGPQRAVISCCCRTPRHVTMTSTRGAGGRPVQRWGRSWLFWVQVRRRRRRQARSAAAGQGRHPPGPAAVATWPAEVPRLPAPPAAGRHPGAQPPDFRATVPRLSRDVTPSLQLTGVLSVRAFRALADGTTRTASWDATSLGSRSMRREEAAAHAGLPRPLVPQALRHASARSDATHILESAKLTFVAAAP